MCHGIIDFACENAWDLQRAAFYVGCDQTEFDYNERNELTSHFNQMELDQRSTLETSVKGLLDVDESGEDYASARSRTTTGLEIGTLVYGGYKGLQGLYNLGKKLYCSGRKFFKSIKIDPKLLTSGKNKPSLPRDKLIVGDYSYSKTAGNHMFEVAKRGPNKGKLSRPFMKSPHTIDEIMSSANPIPDPGGLSGGQRWDVPGNFRGSSGTWELVIDPEKK